MDQFAGKVAIVTGGASGIGRALGEGLVRAGAHVTLADINGELAQKAAADITAGNGVAEAATLDVRDAGAVQELVSQISAKHGRLDYLFNNAGIAIFGEARDMTLADWEHILGVNLHGVVNGVAAAYPMMTRQGFGHIVNTASLAGLIPTPAGVAYATTKHAIVGLSTSLRLEAAHFGVKVSAVCPGLIDTPIVDNMKLLNCDRETAMKNMHLKLHPAAECARVVLRGVARNQAIIVVTGFAKVSWALQRLSPGLNSWLIQKIAKDNPLLGREAKGSARPAGQPASGTQ